MAKFNLILPIASPMMLFVRLGNFKIASSVVIMLTCLWLITAKAPSQESAIPINPPFDPSTRPFSDFCRLYVENGLLLAQARIPIEMKNGEVIQSGDITLSSTSPALLRFQCRINFLADGTNTTDLLLIRTPGIVELERLIRDPTNGNRTFILMQTLNAGGTCTMRITNPAVIVNGRQIASGPTPTQVSCQSFAQFVKDNPAEVEQYLRPILKSFGSEKLLYPFDMAVSQLFPELFKADDATNTAVKYLVGKLDSDSPDDREAASGKLKVMGPIALFVVAEINPQSLSPEQSARIAVLMKARLTDQQVAELSTDKDFLIDCLKDSRRPVRAAALTALRKVAGDKIEFDLDADPSQIAEAAEKLRSEVFQTTQP